MNNDTKSTLTGVIGGIIALVVQFANLGMTVETQATITTVVVAITVTVLGYFTNKTAVVK